MTPPPRGAPTCSSAGRAERDLEALTACTCCNGSWRCAPSELEAELGGLLERINAVPHAAFVHGPGLTAGAGGQRRALALHELVRELCLGRHVVTLALPAAAGTTERAGRAGLADRVFRERRSRQRSSGAGHRHIAARTDEGVDVSLCIEGAAGALPDGVTGIALCSLPVAGVEVSIRTAAAGVEAAGTAAPPGRGPADAAGTAARRRADGRRAAGAAACGDRAGERRSGSAAVAVHDPANDVDGEVRDVCLQDGKVVADVGPEARRIDARGMVVMPGGVDIHAHIAGPKVNAARKLSPDDRRDDPVDRTELLRSGTGGLVPSTFATGYRYSLLGYTTVVEAAAPPLAARHVLSELRDTPMIDKAFLILMGNNQVLFELIRESGGAVSQRLRDASRGGLQATGGYGVKLVNPGGVELWKQTQRPRRLASTTRWRASR